MNMPELKKVLQGAVIYSNDVSATGFLVGEPRDTGWADAAPAYPA